MINNVLAIVGVFAAIFCAGKAFFGYGDLMTFMSGMLTGAIISYVFVEIDALKNTEEKEEEGE
jgi:hypothetical protein